MSADITPEQIAEYQRKQQDAEQKRIEEVARNIAEWADSLNVEIVGIAHLVDIGNGVMGIATTGGVRGKK